MSGSKSSQGVNQIDKLYKSTVRNISKMIGNDKSTTNVQLDELGKLLFGVKWSGVYAADQFPNFSGNKKYAIMNLDESWMNGSHWIAVIKDNSNLLVYDSFGRPAKDLIPDLEERFIQNGGKKIINTEDDAEQSKQQASCGQRSLSAIFIYDQWGKKSFLSL